MGLAHPALSATQEVGAYIAPRNGTDKTPFKPPKETLAVQTTTPRYSRALLVYSKWERRLEI
jgi:hypothetical protein